MQRRWVLLMIGLCVVVLGGATMAQAACGIVHVVAPGETLSGIAWHYGVDPTTLARQNGIVNPNQIYVGQRLTVPTANCAPAPVCTTCTGAYVVRVGDTLFSIARAYGVDVWALARANNLYDANHIYVGQRLTIPGLAPAPTPAPTTSPAQPAASGAWYGEYYTGSELSGAPLFTRNDRAVDFRWGLRSPDTRLNTDQFSVRWTRTINFRGGVYRLHVIADDGVRLWVDGVAALDAWTARGEAVREVDVTLTPGAHLIGVDYCEDAGNATIQFTFRRLGNAPAPVTTPTPSPAATATPGGSALPADSWLGEYFGNISLQGKPVVTRYDGFIGYEWQTQEPLSGIPADFFSVRWSRVADFWEDNYAFCARADDGVRIYVDDRLVLDEWHGSPGQVTACQEVDLVKGKHRVRVEYYEDGGAALVYAWWERR